jgi:hypothetical protein
VPQPALRSQLRFFQKLVGRHAQRFRNLDDGRDACHLLRPLDTTDEIQTQVGSLGELLLTDVSGTALHADSFGEFPLDDCNAIGHAISLSPGGS